MFRHPKKLAFLVGALAASVTSSLSAAEEAAVWSVSRLIERAYENSSDLKISESERAGSEAAAIQAGRWDNPEVSLSGGPKTAGSFSGNTFGVSFSQNVPLFGQKGAAANIERQNQRLSEENYRQARLRLSHSVLLGAYALAATSEHAKHTERRRSAITSIGQYLRTRPFASPSQAVEKSLIQNRIREIDEKFFELDSLRRQAWNDLNSNLALPERVTPAVRWVEKAMDLNKGDFRTEVIRNHPELQAQSIAVERANAQMSVANGRVFPDVRLGAGYVYERAELTERNYFGMVSLTLPLWGSGGSARTAAEARRTAEVSRLAAIRVEVGNDFEKAWSEYVEAKKRLELFPLKLIPTLEEAIRRAEANWRKGLVPATAFLELEEQVHAQADHVFEAQLTYLKSLSHLYFLAGKPAPEELVQMGDR